MLAEVQASQGEGRRLRHPRSPAARLQDSRRRDRRLAAAREWSRCWDARARREPFRRDQTRVGPPTRPKRAPQRAWNPQALRPGRIKRLRIALLSFDYDSRNHELDEIHELLTATHTTRSLRILRSAVTLSLRIISSQTVMTKPLQVMKFGGTSVGDSTCIARAAQIVASTAKGMRVVVVVSAMSGVTNRLIDSAKRAGEGDTESGAALVEALRHQHRTALAALVSDETDRTAVEHQLEAILRRNGNAARADATHARRHLQPGRTALCADFRRRVEAAWRKKPLHRSDGTNCHGFLSRWRGTSCGRNAEEVIRTHWPVARGR